MDKQKQKPSRKIFPGDLKTNLISSKLYSSFPFDQGGIDLHNDGLYGIGTAPALKVHVRETQRDAD